MLSDVSRVDSEVLVLAVVVLSMKIIE